jgi:hypothetical protein
MRRKEVWLVAGLVAFEVTLANTVVVFLPQAVHSQTLLPKPPMYMYGLLGVILLWCWSRIRTVHQPLAAVLLWAGFLGNLAVRVVWGSYLDYIPTGVSYTNSADLMIGVGAVWAIWQELTWIWSQKK